MKKPQKLLHIYVDFLTTKIWQFESVSLGHYVEPQPHISEEWPGRQTI